MKKLIFIFVSCLSIVASALDEVQELGMRQAQKQLTDPKLRDSLIKVDKDAKKADAIATLTVMGNKDYKNEMYNISAELLEWVARQPGDPAVTMEKFKRNPAEFLRQMPQQHYEKVKALAEAIEKQRKPERYPASESNP
jgi:hypothetical protein